MKWNKNMINHKQWNIIEISINKLNESELSDIFCYIFLYGFKQWIKSNQMTQKYDKSLIMKYYG